MIEGYGRANIIASAGASEQSRAVVEMSKDTQVDLQAYQQILEAQNNPSQAEKVETLVTYLYST